MTETSYHFLEEDGSYISYHGNKEIKTRATLKLQLLIKISNVRNIELPLLVLQFREGREKSSAT